MSRGAGVERRFVGLTVTRWLPTGLTIPVTGLLMLSRGLSLADIGLGVATQGIVVILLELPTGGLADAVGRRPVLLAATVLDLVALSLLLVAGSLLGLMAAMGVQGVYRALESGPLEAWYVDARLAADPEADLEAGLARAGVAIGLAIAAGGLVSAALATWPPLGGVEPLALPLALALAFRVVDLAAIGRFLTEHRPARGPGAPSAWASVAATPAVVRSALGLLWATPALLALVAIELSWGAGLSGVEMFSAPRLAELLGDAERGAAVAGVASAVAWSICAGGSALTGWFSRLVGGGPARAGAVGRLAQGGAVLVAAVVAGPAGLLAGYFAFYLVHGAANAVHYGMVHRLVGPEHRATMISASSVAARLGGVAAGIGLGAVADGAGIPAALGVAAVVLAAAAPLYRVAGRGRPEASEEPVPEAVGAASTGR
jgi:Major Facilitator Superfamily